MNSDILSIIAIFISIGVPVFEYFYNKKINDINIDAHYFDAVYEEYLLRKIPDFRIKIERKDNGEMVGIDGFISLLRDMRKRSLYFKFAKEDFYDEIHSLLQNLEDEFVLLDNVVSVEEYNKFQTKVDSIIYDIYSCIISATHKRNMFFS